MTDREQPEALRLADWLETDIPPNDTTTFADVAAELRRLHKANQALRDRLAQPEPEPVAWHEPGAYGNVTSHKDWALANGWEPLYPEKT